MSFKKIIFLFFVFTLLAVPLSSVLSQDIGLQVDGQSLGDASGLGHTDVRVGAVQIINVALGLLGILTTGLMIYAGFNWMTAGGNEEKIETAKKTMWAAVIGLIIILSAWSITQFVLSRSFRATSGNIIEIY